MRIEGNLAKWNDDRGFGFITPVQGGSEIFVHISAFPKDGHRPTIGERLTFEIEVDRHGKKRARNLDCPTRPTVRTTRQSMSHRRNEKPGFLGSAIPLAIVVALAFYGYSHYSGRAAPQAVVAASSNDQSVSSSFRCDDRTHCSQMTSCTEATYFLRNCPNVQMDGNNDGVPCEQQWCTSPYAR
ncbi:MAG: cold shock domain-containing protein [Nitrosomonas sp.]|uniref:cold shock domain-containing protein n=1 Tax=Nitrosomonas sp. TaxID=42353 RepID=UPI002734B7E5|nr:cold shock domain-containing protein [Nitrosomonas sp.]MDP3282085.1 cold shock domain-containing protein [Nitrosomonas sp.]